FSHCGSPYSDTLFAYPSGKSDSIYWYTASTGGTILASGDTFVTPSLSTSTTYYVEEVATLHTNGFGALDTTIGMGTYQATAQRLFFHAYKDFTIDSLDVYAYINGSFDIVITDSAAS